MSTVSSSPTNLAQPPTRIDRGASTACFVNLGCGSRHHPHWLNIDRWVPDASIQEHDLGRGIPLANESAEVVYHSHVLEHFDRDVARTFLRDCFRVLRPNGVIRVVVPDLERIARLYLQALEESLRQSERWRQNYEWLMLEMYDQAVREKPGGGITDYFRSGAMTNRDFALERMGAVPIERLIQGLRAMPSNSGSQSKRTVRTFLKSLRPSRLRARTREAALRILLGRQDYVALKLGRFRQSGEVHKWMYDRYSLGAALRQAGFDQVQECSAFESQIPGWRDFCLDTEPDGTIYKPDSLYMEAVKRSDRNPSVLE
jgi:SAM-dependent methyltransferase